MQKEKYKFYTQFDVKALDDDVLEITGLASTFGGNPDRQGDIISPKAFDATISDYMSKNPIVLCDHESKCEYAIGRVIKAEITTRGLEIVVRISNAKDSHTQSIRTKLREGILCTFSIGGWFYYDGNMIKQVDLFEISIVAVPANADATFAVKSFDGLLDDARLKLKAGNSQMQPNPQDSGSMQSKVKNMASCLLDGDYGLNPSIAAGLKKLIKE